MTPYSEYCIFMLYSCTTDWTFPCVLPPQGTRPSEHKVGTTESAAGDSDGIAGLGQCFILLVKDPGVLPLLEYISSSQTCQNLSSPRLNQMQLKVYRLPTNACVYTHAV